MMKVGAAFEARATKRTSRQCQHHDAVVSEDEKHVQMVALAGIRMSRAALSGRDA
jgi:hypothetical protein